MSGKLMSMAAYARHRKVNRSTITRAVAGGLIKLVDGKIDPSIADVEYQSSPTRTTQASKSVQTASSPLAQSRAVKEGYHARLAKLEWERRSGETVSRADVERDAFEAARRLRDAILAVPDRVAAILAAESDEFLVHKALKRELSIAMKTIGDQSG